MRCIKCDKNLIDEIKGVTFYKPYQKWRARICKEKTCYELGLFHTREESVLAIQKVYNTYFPDGKLCKSCRFLDRIKKNNDHCKRLKGERVKNGGCIDCCSNQALMVPTRKRTPVCEVCYLKRLATTWLGSRRKWEDLKKLHEQQPKCPYTGLKLILGINTTLDHKTPRSKGGDSSFDNLQWVYGDGNIDINMMKIDLTDAQFRELIKRIAKNISG